MTSLAFIMGVVPLVFSSGAGFEIRQAMGIAVFAGMLGVTLFGLFLTPVFYIVIGRLTRRAARTASRQRSPGHRLRRKDTDHDSDTDSFAALTVVPLALSWLDWVRRAAALCRRRWSRPSRCTTSIPPLLAEQSFDPRWWQQFEDPVLDELVSRTLVANHDVRMAVARVDQARAVFDDVANDRFPVVTAGATVDHRDEAIPGFSEQPRRLTTYRLGFDAFWEIDVFGRIRSQVRAAAATAESFEADRRRRTRQRGGGSRAQLLRGAWPAAATGRRRAQPRESAGDAASHRGAARRRVRRRAGCGKCRRPRRRHRGEHSADQERASREREHRIAVLIAMRPGALEVDLSPRPYPALAKALAIGEPDTLLRRRPDVRSAERRLAAATAREGVAAADLYPQITVTGFLGLLAGRGNPFNVSDTRAWAVTPALSWAAFDLGSARARLRGVEGATRESLAEFEQVVLRALEETENALVNYREDQQRLVKLTDQARESTRAATIARVRYREGVVDFLALLDAERTQLQAEDAVAQAEAGVFTSVIALYKALGGIPIS